MSLKSGCVREMFQGNVNTPCAVQVLEVKRLSANSAAGSAPAAERFRLSISDGIHFMQAMVATQLNPRVFRLSRMDLSGSRPVMTDSKRDLLVITVLEVFIFN